MLEFNKKKRIRLSAKMHRKTFVCLSTRTINPVYTIFNTYSDENLINVYKFQDIRRISTRIGETDRPTNRMNKHFSALLESVKKGKLQADIAFEMV